MLLDDANNTASLIAKYVNHEPDTGTLMATLVMTSWIINKYNPPSKKDGDGQQSDAKKKKPKPPPDPRLNPFSFDRRENNPIGDHCYLTPPEYGVDAHEAWGRGLVKLCNMHGWPDTAPGR